MTTTIFDSRTLVSSESFEKVVRYVAREHYVHPRDARRIVEQALAFTQLCAENRGRRLAAPEDVSLGHWALILHTEVYAELCARLGGFLHYEPVSLGQQNADEVQETAALMRRAGLPVDEDLWNPEGSSFRDAGDCG
ncbi:hypothetical protein AGRA3207_002214 [Actinomadura graeca]|uniref:Uncharacterized protein n=1 Tax=Actinomadura graeca TaxID=2750812 RepID=A0ABX8QRD2_9ACTN|nr:hypothetical protein [Actinomadura graeca]QXJ21366.1 hypothetical protein AGRA3207_002214 [Actinomadura graeca]